MAHRRKCGAIQAVIDAYIGVAHEGRAGRGMSGFDCSSSSSRCWSGGLLFRVIYSLVAIGFVLIYKTSVCSTSPRARCSSSRRSRS
ncbi:MAG: hypothetical protein QM796_01605 [Chthoniobacteraceae bacterium]